MENEEHIKRIEYVLEKMELTQEGKELLQKEIKRLKGES